MRTARSGSRWAASAHPANLVLTNVHGPGKPLYLLDSELVGLYPIVPLMPGQSLAIAVLSYAGQLYWGFHADKAHFTGLDDWSSDVARAFDELYFAATRP